MVKDFEPYALLWENAAGWQRANKEWLDGSFLSLDADAVTRDFENMQVRLYVNINVYMYNTYVCINVYVYMYTIDVYINVYVYMYMARWIISFS